MKNPHIGPVQGTKKEEMLFASEWNEEEELLWGGGSHWKNCDRQKRSKEKVLRLDLYETALVFLSVSLIAEEWVDELSAINV